MICFYSSSKIFCFTKLSQARLPLLWRIRGCTAFCKDLFYLFSFLIYPFLCPFIGPCYIYNALDLTYFPFPLVFFLAVSVPLHHHLYLFTYKSIIYGMYCIMSYIGHFVPVVRILWYPRRVTTCRPPQTPADHLTMTNIYLFPDPLMSLIVCQYV